MNNIEMGGGGCKTELCWLNKWKFAKCFNSFVQDCRLKILVPRIFQRGDHTVSHSGYLHGPLQMFGPANGVCNYLALETKYGIKKLQ